MAACVFITKEKISLNGDIYEYKDSIMFDEEENMLIECKGQKTGKGDHIIENSEKIHVFHRKNKNCEFTYYGESIKIESKKRKDKVGTKTKNIEDLASFRLMIEKDKLINTIIVKNKLYKGSGCLKKACLSFIGSKIEKQNLCCCFVKFIE
jgi:hypothetical protein